jgi:hypothetical protein
VSVVEGISYLHLESLTPEYAPTTAMVTMVPASQPVNVPAAENVQLQPVTIVKVEPQDTVSSTALPAISPTQPAGPSSSPVYSEISSYEPVEGGLEAAPKKPTPLISRKRLVQLKVVYAFLSVIF